MALKFIQIPVRDPAEAELEANKFLSCHRVVTIDRRFVEDAQNSFWAICVDYLHGETAPQPLVNVGGREKKVDYKELLSPELFEIFARLRLLRKELADRDAVPVYAVFTNEQLAEIVRAGVDSRAKLKSIPGVGDAKIEKYGDLFLKALSSPA